MTRKHFKLFAVMFKYQLIQIDTAEVWKNNEQAMIAIHQKNMLIDIIKQTSAIFQMNNPRFDRHKFWIACGLSVNDE